MKMFELNELSVRYLKQMCVGVWLSECVCVCA